MLYINESTAIKHLREFSLYFGGDLIENYNAASMYLDNEKGKGVIHSYDIFPGLEVRVYNITFYEDFVVDMTLSKDRPHYFSFNVKGHIFHRFENEEEFQKIEQNQNLIIIGAPDTKAITIFPKNVKIEMSIIILNKNQLTPSHTNRGRSLEVSLQETFNFVEHDAPYRYTGDIDLKTLIYSKVILKNNRTDLVGKLITEGAVLNKLANQINAHDKHKKNIPFDFILSNEELSKITQVGDYIENNIQEKITVEILSNAIGMSPKKLQAGVKFLYGDTVSKFIVNLRMEYARDLIQSTDLSISETCYAIGLSSRSYFSKKFEERFGILPSDYKKSFYKSNAVYELSYRSRSVSTFDGTDLEDIVIKSRNENEKKKISGCLIYCENVFFQILEGPKKAVLELFEKIENDTRHTEIKTLWKGAKLKRNFSKWDLALISDQNILKIPTNGHPKNLNIDHLLNDLKEPSIASDILWRRVRNIIKTS